MYTQMQYTAFGGQQFCKEWRKLQTRTMFERYYSFFLSFPLSCRYLIFQKLILSKPKRGHKQTLGRHGPLDSHSDGIVSYSSTKLPVLQLYKNIEFGLHVSTMW